MPSKPKSINPSEEAARLLDEIDRSEKRAKYLAISAIALAILALVLNVAGHLWWGW